MGGGNLPTAKRSPDVNTLHPLLLHLEVRNHSPSGFAWGCGANELAQLALALLLDDTGDEDLALRHYQEVKREHVSRWQHEWTITVHEILGFVAPQERQHSALDVSQKVT